LLNGEGDLLPGLLCDVYGSSAVLKLDGDGFIHCLNDCQSKLFLGNDPSHGSLLPAVCLLLHATFSCCLGYRLLNGEGDLLPGLVCDVYGSSAVLKLDGEGFIQ
jgi:23S rRNA G2069 N7-methylase RlmK/C1962 C5-methylase RlmI